MRLSLPLFIAISLCLARPVDAQTSITLDPCWRPMIGVGLGPMVNGDRNGDGSEYDFPGKGAARQINASIDVPVGGEWAGRIEAGSVSWAFEQYDFRGNRLQRDEVRLKRLTAGAMKSFGGFCDIPLRLFAGGGLGVYRYEYAQGGFVTRGGAHVFAGIDVLFGDRAAVFVVAAMHFVDGPARRPVFSELFAAGGLTVGVKFGF